MSGRPENPTELMEGIFEMIAKLYEYYSANGIVEEVDVSTGRCRVKLDDGNADVQFVKYVVNPSSPQGVWAVPKVGSQVTVSFIDNNQGVITNIQEFDYIQYDAGEDTVTAAEKLETKLNRLVFEVDQLRNMYNLHVHTDPISGSTGTTSNPAATTITQFNKDEFNYSKIKIP